jgi:hypothetical protein
MNFRKYLLATFAMFVFVFLYEMGVHGFLLSGQYEKTASVWRSMAEMEADMPYGMLFQLLFSAWTAYVFTQLFKNGGIENGLRYGLYFGVFAGLLTASWYLVLPIPAQLGASWFVSSLIEGLGSGLILGAIYKR